MNTVVDLNAFRGRIHPVPTLVLVDLHEDLRRSSDFKGSPYRTQALTNCRAVLRHARASGFPVGFTRQVSATSTLLQSPVYPSWIEGFEPKRCDMIFDRQRPSCYNSTDFSEMAQHLGGSYVIAGQISELSCLSTVVDAFHRDHRVVVLCDALISHDCEPLPKDTISEAITRILSHYAEPVQTQAWIQSSSRKAWLEK
jgi:nicotinamidase-related amidase